MSNIVAKLRPSNLNNFQLVRGVVVSTKDDKFNIGRVQVRIYNIHGSNDNGVADKDLPWATPCTLSSSHDAGSYIIPEVGTSVWILFENGDISTPVYLGGIYGSGISTYRELGRSGYDNSYRAQPLQENELPKNIVSEHTQVLYKSPKGKSIVFDDNDEIDNLYIRDHLGQVILLESQMNPEYIQNYPFKDQYVSTMKDLPFSAWDYLKGQCKIIFKSLSHSLFSIISDKFKSIVTIKSKNFNNESSINLVSSDNDTSIIFKINKRKIKLTESGIFIDGKEYKLIPKDSE